MHFAAPFAGAGFDESLSIAGCAPEFGIDDRITAIRQQLQLPVDEPDILIVSDSGAAVNVKNGRQRSVGIPVVVLIRSGRQKNHGRQFQAILRFYDEGLAD